MAFGTKTNERPGTRAQVRHVRVSAYKAREVLDLIRGLHVDEADDILRVHRPRRRRRVIRKVPRRRPSPTPSTTTSIDPDELYVSACYADEGPTLKRWRPRARGRATRIRKRTCHITIIVSRMDAEEARAAPGPHRRRRRPRWRAPRRRRGPPGPRRQEPGRQRRRREAEHDHDHEATTTTTRTATSPPTEVDGRRRGRGR